MTSELDFPSNDAPHTNGRHIAPRLQSLDADDPEVALVAAVMGDVTGGIWNSVRHAPVDIFSNPEVRRIWRAISAGTPLDDGVRIIHDCEIDMARFIEWSSLDRTGAYASIHLNSVANRWKDREMSRLAGQIAVESEISPQKWAERAAEIGRRLKAITGAAIDQPKLKSTPLTAFTVPPKDDRSVLLGNRYLNRGDGGIIVSSSGMGKSSLYVLAAVMWALGRDFFGIKPNGPLRSLLVQSEDSDGDVAEVWFSILSALQLTPDQIQQVTDRVVIVTDRIHRGAPFIAELRKHIAAFKPDLVWINPLVAFIDGDVKEASDAGKFLRDGLNGLNADAQFGYIIIHHTTKPPSGEDKKDRNWSEIMYDMAGSYDLIGWARFIISLRPTPKPGDFNMVLAKRGRRAGVTRTREQGAGTVEDVSTTIPLRHSTDRITLPTGDEIFSLMWHTRDPDPAGEVSPGKPKVHHWARIAEFVPIGEANMKGVGEIAKAAEQTGVARNSIRGILDEAYNDGVVQRRVISTVLKYWR